MSTRLTHIAPILLVLAGIVFLVTPSHPGSGSDGLPLQPMGVLVALLLPAVLYGLWGWIPARPAMIAAATLLALTAVKLIIAAMSPEYGLQASYYENQRFTGRPEKSSEYRLPNATRFDRAIDFGGDEFPVYFFNDSERFNFFNAGQPQRRQLPFSARWTGVLLVPFDHAAQHVEKQLTLRRLERLEDLSVGGIVTRKKPTAERLSLLGQK